MSPVQSAEHRQPLMHLHQVFSLLGINVIVIRARIRFYLMAAMNSISVSGPRGLVMLPPQAECLTCLCAQLRVRSLQTIHIDVIMRTELCLAADSIGKNFRNSKFRAIAY